MSPALQIPSTAQLRLRGLTPEDAVAQAADEDEGIVRRHSGQRNTEAGHRNWLVGAQQRWESGADVFDPGIEVCSFVLSHSTDDEHGRLEWLTRPD